MQVHSIDTLSARIAEALKGTRPEQDGPALRQWSDDVVAVATALAVLYPTLDRGAFFTACGGL